MSARSLTTIVLALAAVPAASLRPGAAGADEPAIVFPERHWQERAPSALGLDEAKLRLPLAAFRAAQDPAQRSEGAVIAQPFRKSQRRQARPVAAMPAGHPDMQTIHQDIAQHPALRRIPVSGRPGAHPRFHA